jgi:hypothetical protein
LLQALGQQGIPLVVTRFPLTAVLQTATNRVPAGMLTTPLTRLRTTSLSTVSQESSSPLVARLFIAALLDATAVDASGLDVASLLTVRTIAISMAPPTKVVDTSLAFVRIGTGRQAALH